MAGTAGRPTSENVERMTAFLFRHPLFREVERQERARVAGETTVRTVTAGAPVLVEGGPPETHLSLIVEGAVEILIDGEVVDILESGDVVDVSSVLSALPPTFNARAREDTSLLLVPREAAMAALSRPSGVTFLAGSLGERLVRAARAVRPVGDPRSVPIASLVRRPPVFCHPETPVRVAAERMSRDLVSAVLVETRDGLGIVSNADLRDKVVAAGLSADAPVSSIMSTPVLTIPEDRLAWEAGVAMLEKGVNHIVVVDARERPTGVVSTAGLLTPAELSPLSLRRSIRAARDEADLLAVARRIPESFIALIDAGLDAPAISRTITLEADALTERLLALAKERHGPAPCAFAWLALGSAGRNELTLASDQDNSLAYEDTEDPAVDAYFARVADDVNQGLQRCGFKLDDSGVVARDRLWRMPRSRWVRVLRDTFEAWDLKHTVWASVAFDFRRVAGDLDVAPLIDVLLEAREHASLLGRIARTATDIPSPLGFRHRLTGPVDIKRSALLPMQNMARYYALANGVTTTSTLDRLAAVRDLGGRGAESAAALPDAFRAVWHLRLRHHANALRAGRHPDDAIDSTTLRPLTHAEVQQALRIVVAAQKRMPRVLSPADFGAHV